MGKHLKAEARARMGDPLTYAVNRRDACTIGMVDEAIRFNNVRLAYQPVVQAQKPDHVGYYEGLLRVLDPSGRIIPARDFIDAIEETETGRLMDCIALSQGLAALRETPDLRLAINMSARSIGFRKWTRTLSRGLMDDPTIAERLILEITEQSAMLVPELVINFMDELRVKGVAFALDDFGAGYTAFRYFKQFHFDILKIDGLFIRGIARDPDNQVMTKAMISVGQQFDMFTVAESVENAADAAYLTQIGVDCLQGYYYGAPTVAEPWKADARERKSA